MTTEKTYRVDVELAGDEAIVLMGLLAAALGFEEGGASLLDCATASSPAGLHAKLFPFLSRALIGVLEDSEADQKDIDKLASCHPVVQAEADKILAEIAIEEVGR